MSDSNFTPLTDDQMDKLAEKAADRAVAKITTQFFVEIGKGFVNKIFFVIGVVVVGVLSWWYGKNGG